MSSKAKTPKTKKRSRTSGASSTSPSGGSSTSALRSSGYLLTCDPSAKQFVINMNDGRTADKKFILEDLDTTHLLIKGEARNEITRRVEEWMDENVFSTLERVGENLDAS